MYSDKAMGDVTRWAKNALAVVIPLALGLAGPSWSVQGQTTPATPSAPAPAREVGATPSPGRTPLAQALAGQTPLKEGRGLTSGGESYVLLPEVRAMPRSAPGLATGKPPLMALETLGAEPQALLETRGPYLVYRTGPDETPAPRLTPGGPTSLPVVRNTRTGRLGVLTGTLAVRLAEDASAENLAKAHDLTVGNRLAGLGVVFLRSGPGRDLFALVQELASDRRVKEARLDILEHAYQPL